MCIGGLGKGPELARPSALRASRGEPDEWDDECFATAKPESAAGIRDGPLVTDPEKPPLSLLCGGFSFGKQYMFEDVALFILEKIQGRLAEDTLDYILALAIREDVTSLRLASCTAPAELTAGLSILFRF